MSDKRGYPLKEKSEHIPSDSASRPQFSPTKTMAGKDNVG